MEVYREMFLRGEPEQLAATLELISQRLPPGWSRDKALESRLRTRTWNEERGFYCFRVEGADLLPDADLYLIECDDRTFKVSNVVPRDQAQLSFGRYNALLEEFCDRIARPCAEETGVVIELASNHVDLEHWLSQTATRKLMAFSAESDNRTTALRKDSRRRWLDFVVTAHREGSRLPAFMLRRWLIEAEGWDPEEADQLASEYEFGNEVLAYSHTQSVGA